MSAASSARLPAAGNQVLHQVQHHLGPQVELPAVHLLLGRAEGVRGAGPGMTLLEPPPTNPPTIPGPSGGGPAQGRSTAEKPSSPSSARTPARLRMVFSSFTRRHDSTSSAVGGTRSS